MNVLVVTDPMCSWCWGMSAAVEEAADRLSGEAEFHILLGGVNTDATQPAGDYAQRLLKHIWREVAATTGAPFAFAVPDGLVYNSVRPCLAVAAVRRHLGRPPFGYLHRLQQLFFQEGRNTNDPALLAAAAEDFGVPRGAVMAGLEDPVLRESVRAEIAGARQYGTHALPSVLVETAGERSLLLGGYADAATLEAMIRARMGSSG